MFDTESILFLIVSSQILFMLVAYIVIFHECDIRDKCSIINENPFKLDDGDKFYVRGSFCLRYPSDMVYECANARKSWHELVEGDYSCGLFTIKCDNLVIAENLRHPELSVHSILITKKQSTVTGTTLIDMIINLKDSGSVFGLSDVEMIDNPTNPNPDCVMDNILVFTYKNSVEL